MAKKFNIDSTKGKVKDIQGNIDAKKKEYSKLEKEKANIIEGRINLENAEMDENIQRLYMEGLSKAREKITERGKELSAELNDDASVLEEIAQETDDVTIDTKAQLKDAEKKNAALDKLGFGSPLEDSINKMGDNINQLNDLRTNISKTSQEVRNLQTQLGNL